MKEIKNTELLFWIVSGMTIVKGVDSMVFAQLQVTPMKVEEKMILQNIYPLYLHDLSEYCDQEMREDGTYDIAFLDLFFEKEDLVPFLIRLNEWVVGFILIQKGTYAPSSGEDYYLSEFFILRNFRKRGLGREAVRKLFTQYPGTYLLGQLPNNLPAIHFWKSVYRSIGVDFQETLQDFGDYQLFLQSFRV